MPEFPQRFGLDLANALTRHVELFAHFLERVIGVHVDTETHAKYLCLARRQAGQHALCVVSFKPCDVAESTGECTV